ncbi:transposase [Paenibacillus arenosi]|uniref:Transposase n=1 Tax=Paenibacillus arenosi TaxID=2774142 RepID=A0ABR9B1D3_9BACL|nr:transposase [Paenibacillus arenosi]MBD8499265.1 transposase [Paenibacillus arenosi]
MFLSMLQSILSKVKVESVVSLIAYHDTARNFNVYTLLQYWAQAAFAQWNGFLDGAEHIAKMYKVRWQVELLFRWIQKHWDVSTLNGTSENEVYGGDYVYLLVYVLINALYDHGNLAIPKHVELPFVHASRLLILGLSGIFVREFAFLSEEKGVLAVKKLKYMVNQQT